jgi:beta propeller repeat protein
MYDLATNEETPITTDPATQFRPAISGDCIVWTDTRNGNFDIYMYTLDTTTDPFYYYPATTFQGEETELTVIVKLTEIAMNIGDPVQWYITKPSGETITGESDTLKCCRVGGLYDTAFYDFPDYGMYTIKVEFPGYTAYAEWDVEVWGPTGEIIGEVTNPTGDPIENVDVYLYDAEDKYKVSNFIDEWRSDPTTSVPSYISSTKTGSTGNYQLTEIIPGSYLVLAVPQVDMEYLPKTSDVYVIEKDETEIIDLQLEPKVRWLAELDDAMEHIRYLSIETVDNNTRAAAEVYVDGYKTFYDPKPDADWSKLLSVVLGAINLAMDTMNPATTVAKVQLACHGFITNQIAVPIAENGIDLAIADHWWNVRGTTFQDEMSYCSNQVNSTTWMMEFYPNTVGSPEDALQNGYYTTPMYINSLSLIDDSFEDYNKTIAYTDVPSDFSLSQTENVLGNQVFWLHDKTDGETKIADGIIITPTGNVYLFKLAQAHRDGYNNAKLEMGVAKTGQTISEVTYTCGNYISYKGACTLNPHAVGIGMTVKVIGWAGGIAFNSYEIYAKNKVAKQWAYTQIYWAQDLDTIPKINQDIVEWLGRETQDPRLPYIDGNIVDTDIHLLQIPLTNKNIAFANEPNYPWWWILPRLRWWILNTNTVTIESTSSIDSVKTRILCIDRYGNKFVSEMPTIHPNETEPPMLMDRYETKTIDLPYTGDFQPFNPFHWHYLSTILWMEGKQPDMETDVYYVIPLSFSPLPYTIPGKTTMSAQEVNTLLKQPMGSEVCAFTTKETKSDSSITLEDWGNLLGNCTKIIDISLDPINDSTQVRYASNASITDVTFLMATIPGSHLNLHVYDELGRHVGYFPVTDSDQIQIPNATYTGNISNPEIILIPDAAGKNYTIKVDATQFTSSSPIPVEVYAIETPVRPAVLGISPVELYPFTSPGETKNITMQLAEVGKQVDIEDVTILQHDFTDKFGNPVPEVTATFSQNNFDIGAGNTTYLTITINVPKNITLPDLPETRYSGNITIETLNAGSLDSTIHLLVLDTDFLNAKLTFAEPNVSGVHLSSIDISDIRETYKPAGVTPRSAYKINSTGSGNFTLQFTDIPNANTNTAFKINSTNHWIPLNTITTTDSVTFEMSVVDTRVVFASTEELIQPSSTVLYPNGGESIPVGTQVRVSAHATDDNGVTSVTFYYSSNSGATWNSTGAGAIVSGTAKDGTWNKTWNTNGLSAGTNYLIKAVASNGILTSEDQSDSTFSLTCTPPNLIDNGDFEIIDPSDSSNPDGWTLEVGGRDYPGYGLYKDVLSDCYYSGLHSVHFRLDGYRNEYAYGIIKSPLIDTVQGDLYWYQSQVTQFDASDIEYTIKFYDENDNLVSSDLYYTDTTTSQAGPPGCTSLQGDSDMNPPAVIVRDGGPARGDSWYKFSSEIPDIGTDKFRFEIHIYQWEAPNKVGDGDACGSILLADFDNFYIEPELPEKVIFADDFDSYATGSFPSSGGWNLKYNGRGNSYQIVDGSQSVSSPNSLKLEGQKNWAAAADHALSETPDQVLFEADVKVTRPNGGTDGWANAYVVLVDPDVGWGTHYGTVLFGADQLINGKIPYNFDQWYHVKAKVDMLNRKNDVWIDDEFIGTFDISSDGYYKCIRLDADNSGHTRAWFDNVKVYRGDEGQV